MIRLATPEDLPALLRVAEATRMFLGDELDSFGSQMHSHLLAPAPGVGLLSSLEGGGAVVGAAYFAPERMAQGVMNLLFIGVAPEARRAGHGAALLAHFEEAVREANARLAIIETASDPMFAPAWRLYRGAGYEEEARVRDYYDDGLDKLTFRKRV